MAITAEVIGALLTKFNIVDNVMKFALYQRSFDDPRRQLGTYTSRHLPKAVTRGVFWVFEHPRNFKEKLDTQNSIQY